MTMTIRTLRKECTYKNEKYKVEVKKYSISGETTMK